MDSGPGCTQQIKCLRSSITEQLTYRLDMGSEVVHYHNYRLAGGWESKPLSNYFRNFVRCCSP